MSIEITGTVKWFNYSKGYGFVVRDGLPSDVLLQRKALTSAGYDFACPGARIRCSIVRGARGLRVERVSALELPAGMPADSHSRIPAASGWVSAQVTSFNRDKGYGFLTADGVAGDIFLHMETLLRFRFGPPYPGQAIRLRYGRGNKGLIAVELSP